MKILKLFYQSIYNLIIHDGVEHAGYMSFLTILSFFPFLVFITAFTGFIGNSHIGIELINNIATVLPEDLTKSLLPRVNEIKSGPPASLLTISVLGAVWTASSSFEGLRTIFNRVYQVKTLPSYFTRRVRSILEFFIMSVFLVVGTVILLTIPYFISGIEDLAPKSEIFQHLYQRLVGIEYFFNSFFRYIYIACILFISLIFVYYQIPNAKIQLKDLIPGTILVIIGWFLCAELLSEYISIFEQVNLIYGSLGGIIASLLFFFFIHLILIWGAEFNFLYNLYRLEKGKNRN